MNANLAFCLVPYDHEPYVSNVNRANPDCPGQRSTGKGRYQREFLTLKIPIGKFFGKAHYTEANSGCGYVCAIV